MSSAIPVNKKITMQINTQKAKKLVTILATSTSMTGKKTNKEKLERVPCIWYSIIFNDQIEALLDSESKVNIMNSAFVSQLGLKIWKTNVGAQKIDGTTLETYGMIVFIFSMSDKDGKKRFFEESFLLTEVKLEIVVKMPFLTMSNAVINFQARDL